jgi:hypothetical protein
MRQNTDNAFSLITAVVVRELLKLPNIDNRGEELWRCPAPVRCQMPPQLEENLLNRWHNSIDLKRPNIYGRS